MSKETLKSKDFLTMGNHVQTLLNSLKTAKSQLSPYLEAQKTIKKYRKSVQSKSGDLAEDFVEWHKQHKKSPKTREELENALKIVQNAHGITLLETALKKSLSVIMSIRNIFKTQINYGVFIRDPSGANGGQNLWLQVYTNLDEILAQGKINLSTGSLVIEKTKADLDNILYDIKKGKAKNRYINILETSEAQQLWGLLSNIKEKLGRKYNYGQLVESFVYLAKQSNFNPNEGEIYSALLQGANTIPFEIKGDFEIQDEFYNMLDIQSKLFSAGGYYDTKTVSLLSISNAERVLTKIQIALRGTSVEEMKFNLEQAFKLKENESQRNFKNEEEIKKIIHKEKEKLQNIIWNNNLTK